MIKKEIVEVSILFLGKTKKPPLKLKVFIRKLLKQLAELSLPNKKVKVTLILTNKTNMLNLNRNFRNKNKEALTLAFPLIKRGDNFIISQNEIMLGDIFIDLETIEKRNAHFVKGIKKNIIHSFLHLLSYTHNNDQDEKKMNLKAKELEEATDDF
jgi:rRNA maturation RNase YbeY